MNYRKNNPAAQRFAERRQRENEAPRLSAEVPGLVSLRLEIEERGGSPQPKYIRRIMVDTAPALFLLPCGDPRCVDGGHDVTTTVMQSLRARRKTFEGNDDCPGTVGSGPCARAVHFEGIAEYRP